MRFRYWMSAAVLSAAAGLALFHDIKAVTPKR